MKNLLITVAIVAILVGLLPRIFNSGYFSFASRTGKPSAATNAPPPAPTSSTADGWIKHPSGLGGNGGLGNASLTESALGRLQVYTPDTLPGARDGQVVRIRFSRPSVSVWEMDANNYTVALSDKEHGSIAVIFPKVGAQKMGLPNSKFQPGLSFYIALDPGGVRAVGNVWRPDTKTYTW